MCWGSLPPACCMEAISSRINGVSWEDGEMREKRDAKSWNLFWRPSGSSEHPAPFIFLNPFWTQTMRSKATVSIVSRGFFKEWRLHGNPLAKFSKQTEVYGHLGSKFLSACLDGINWLPANMETSSDGLDICQCSPSRCVVQFDITCEVIKCGKFWCDSICTKGPALMIPGRLVNSLRALVGSGRSSTLFWLSDLEESSNT